jgi:NAD(P)-dependent dehydrogenase (short-subunit alcohol dehydrogenase family)
MAIVQTEFERNAVSGMEGKVIAITAASSGIGEATARLLGERGAKIVLGARGPTDCNLCVKVSPLRVATLHMCAPM